MEANLVIGNKKSIIIYDYWLNRGVKIYKKLNLDLDVGKICKSSNLKNISSTNDLSFFVWTGTSTDMSIKNLDFIENNHKLISDINHSIYIDIPWRSN